MNEKIYRKDLSKFHGQIVKVVAKYSGGSRFKKTHMFRDIMINDTIVTDHLWMFLPNHNIKFYNRCSYEIIGAVKRYVKIVNGSMVFDYKISNVVSLKLIK